MHCTFDFICFSVNTSQEEMDINGGDLDCIGLGGLASKLKVSGMIGDSIMMGIVNSAMEQAFDKAFRCKEGIIWRLNQKSRFCELAIMQLDWCLTFVQQEIDSTTRNNNNSSNNNDLLLFDDNDDLSPSSSVTLHKKLILDLTDTRDRILCHLRETEFALWDKDRELSDETPLSRDLLLLNSGGTVSGEDGTGDFCELRNSVDQQFFNIKQNLEDERVNFTKGGTGEEVETEEANKEDEEEEDDHVDDSREDKSEGSNNQFLNRSAGYEKMQWDIDVLKETFDVALGMMSKATSLAEIGPIERQWRWEVEKDTMALVFRGFLAEIQHAHVGDNWWSSLMVEIASLRHQLHHLVTENVDNSVNLTTPPPTTSMSVNTTCDVSSTQDSTGVKEKDEKEEREQGQGSLVAEMIRNHESIIRQKSEELNWIKGEFFFRTSSVINNKDTSKGRDATITTRTRIQHLISRLDTILAQNLTGRLQQHLPKQQDFGFSSDANSTLIGIMIRHDIFLIVVKEWVKDLHSSLYNEDTIKEESRCQVEAQIVLRNDLDNLEMESLRTLEYDVYMVFFREMVQELKELRCLESFNKSREEILRTLEDDVYMVFFREMVQELKEQQCSFDRNKEDKLESLRRLEDDLYMVFFREMIQELKEQQCSFDRYQEDEFESLRKLEDDVYMVFFRNIIQELKEQQCRLDSNQEEKLQSLRSLEDDVYMVFLRRMVQELKEEKCRSDRNQEEKLESLKSLEDDVYVVFFRKMVQGLKERKCVDCFNRNHEEILRTLENDVHMVFFREMVQELKEQKCCFDMNQEEKLESLRSLEDQVYMVFFREMVQELKEQQRSFDRNQEEKLDSLRVLEDDVYIVFFGKILQELKERQCHFVANQEDKLKILRSLADDVNMVFLREMVQELKEEKCRSYKNLEEKLESLGRLEEDVYMVFFRKMVEELKERQCHFHGNEEEKLESLRSLEDDVYKVFFRKMVQELNEQYFHLEGNQDENLDSLRRLEDDVYMVVFRGMVQEMKEQKSRFDRNEEEKLQRLRLLEDDVYMVYFREMVQELKEQNCVGCYNRKQEEKSHIFLNPNNVLQDLHILEDEGEELRQRKNALTVASFSPSSLLSSLTTFSEEIAAFDTVVHDKIRLSVSRLEELKNQVDVFQEGVILARKRELMYKNAFLLRCSNLQKAEFEVDLLADELEDLLALVEKIYITLDHYSPVLQPHLGIEELLKLIRKEVNRPFGDK